jgi:Domain of unknown function (DUF1996)
MMRISGLLDSRRRRIAVAAAGALILVGATAAVTAAAVSAAPATSAHDASSSNATPVVTLPAVAPGMPSMSMAPMSSAPTSSSPPSTVSTAGFPSGPDQPGIFTDRCAYSHEAADDPILAPNDPGAAMHHNFYGNTATSASTTAAALVGGQTTCTTTADASAYWTPVLYQNGTALTPGPALIYWRKPARDNDAVQTVPVGLQMIAGNETATAPQSTSVTAWTCSGQNTVRNATSMPHNCPAGTDLRLIVTFPSCWDGHTLTAVGQANVVYRTANGCPSSHPIQIPQVVFHVNYPTSSAAGLTVSMTPTMAGSPETEHVDLINGWTESILSADVNACVATSTRCGAVTGPQATPHGPAPSVRARATH